jgi:hypothetical protein
MEDIGLLYHWVSPDQGAGGSSVDQSVATLAREDNADCTETRVEQRTGNRTRKHK